jgi:hypothetical protein
MPARKLTTDSLKEAMTLYAQGLSAGQIAKRFGLARNTVYGRMKKVGFVFRPQLRFGEDNHFHRGGIIASDPAQNKIEKAICRGEVIRPSECELCGAAPRFRDGRSGIQAHHTDYNKPLEVMWLCQPCHHIWHKTNKATARRDQ